MSSRCLFRSAVVLVWLFATIQAASSQGDHTLQGKVALPNGEQPTNSVRVTLTFNGVRVYESFTDLSGRFSFSGLRRGNYQLEAEGDGRTFETTRVNAEVSAFGGAPQSFTQNITLRPIRGKALPPAETVSAEAADPALPQEARESYKKGAKRADENKPEEAVKLFQQAVQAAPGFYLAHLALADQLLKLRRFDEAGSAYAKARDLKTDRAEPLSGLGAVLVQQRQYTEALPLLRRVVEMGKQNSATYLYLGLAETMSGDYVAAEANLLRAFEMNKAPVARVYLANLYELKGEPAKAIEQLQAFLKENPEAPQATQIRGAIEKLRRQTAKDK
jgi:tetratricopeptide (TPR) repeat protein